MQQQVLTRAEARQLDQRAIQWYGISGLVLMENAGRGCADVLCSQGIDGPVLICCGRGNNAGDGLVIARHLQLRGHAVQVFLMANAERLEGDAGANYRILTRTGVPISEATDGPNRSHDALFHSAAWIVDALLGTGAHGHPRPPLDAWIRYLNDLPAQRLAVDVPSGLDCDSGQAGQPTLQADHTCTFVAPKPGLLLASARRYVGQLHVLDIGLKFSPVSSGSGDAVECAPSDPDG